jgi:hypothetical protein
VYSREAGNSICADVFVGSQPPEKIYVYGGRNRCNFDNVYGTHPDEAVKNRLMEIRETIKRNSLSTNVVQQNGNNEQCESITM